MACLMVKDHRSPQGGQFRRGDSAPPPPPVVSQSGEDAVLVKFERRRSFREEQMGSLLQGRLWQPVLAALSCGFPAAGRAVPRVPAGPAAGA